MLRAMMKKCAGILAAVAMLLSAAPAVPAAAADLGAALDAIDMERITGGSGAVADDFLLPLASADGLVKFTWNSSESGVISIYGENAIVLSNPGDREVILTATASADGATQDKAFPLTVKKTEFTGEYLINEDFEDIEIGSLPEDGRWARENYLTDEEANTESSYMGTAALNGEGKALHIYKEAGVKLGRIQGVYAMFDAPKDGEAVVSYDLTVASVTHDSLLPRFTSNNTNTISGAKTFTSMIAIAESGITNYLVSDGSTQFRTPIAENVPFSIDMKVRNKPDVKMGSGFDYYMDGVLKGKDYNTSKNAGSYVNNMVFGLDTNAAKSGDFYIDNVRVFSNEAVVLAKEVTPETVGASMEGNVIGNLDLSYCLPGANVKFVCSEPGVVAPDGTVTHPSAEEAAKQVVLAAVIEKDGYKGIAELPLTIIPNDEATEALQNLSMQDILGATQQPDAIHSSFELPDVLADCGLTWESSEDDVIRIDGFRAMVTRSNQDKPVTLTVTMDVGGAPLTKTFDVTVARISDSEINISEILGQDQGAVSADFELPETTASGDPILWESSDMEKLFLFGQTAYVLAADTAQPVTLSARGTFGGVTAKLEYELTLSPLTAENRILIDEDFENVAVGELPATKLKNGGKNWAIDSSTTATDPNAYNSVVEENSAIPAAAAGNRVLQAGKKEIDSTYGLVHMRFDAPIETVVNAEFDIYADAPNYGHIWLMNSQDTNLNGDLIRMPMKTRSIVVSDKDGNILTNDFPTNTWHKVRFVLDMSNMKYDFYLDGEKKLTDGNIKENGNIFSRVSFGFGKGLNGYNLVDNVRVWVDTYRSIGAYADSIALGDLTEVTQNIKLPQKTPCGEAKITWLSSEPTTLDATGRVIRPTAAEGDKPVTLYALVEEENVRALREYRATVKAEETDEQAVAADYASLTLDTSGFLSSDLTLFQKGLAGSQILWSSSDAAVIDPETGKVTPKPFDDMRITEVTLTAVVKKGGAASPEKNFVFRVPERNYCLKATVTGSSDRIDAPYQNIADNDPATAWSPKDGDSEKYLIITMPNATLASTRINKLRVMGTFDAVDVFYSTSTAGDSFTKLASGAAADLDAPKEIKRLKLAFTGSQPAVAGVGVYYAPSNKQMAQEDAAAVELGNLSAVTGNLILPAVGKINGSTLSWHSDKPAYLRDDGTVTRPENENVKVTLTLTATCQGESVKKLFYPNILKTGGGSGGGGGTPGGGSHLGGGGGVTGNIPYPAVSPAPAPDPEPVAPFNDLEGYGWAESAINAFVEKGVINGVGDGKFAPERQVTRAEFLKMLLAALSIPAGGDSAFADVGADDWFYPVVSAGVAAGIVSGVSEREFMPDTPISRQDISVMTANAAAYRRLSLPDGGPDFADADAIAGYAAGAVSSLAAAGILTGYEDHTFAPAACATRAEAVVIAGRVAAMAGGGEA